MADEQSSVRKVVEGVAIAVLAFSITGAAISIASLRDRVTTGESSYAGLAERYVDLAKRVEQQEQRPPRMSSSFEQLRTDVDRIENEQRVCREATITLNQASQHIREIQNDLCKRLRSCDDLWRALRDPEHEKQAR